MVLAYFRAIMRQLLGIFLIFPFAVFSQEELNIHHYPQDYFRNPLDIPIFLAGNFGECRPGHFHSGVDIKTKGEENQPVHAAADGYISRIKTESGGFGHALYIMHPNGYTTLYAHLNDFSPPIQQYLRKHQYEKERWDLDLQLTPDQFPVKKGDQIAWSGNTGASTAPHLHFEIRNTATEHPLNPELFGLPIVDNIPPVIYEAAIYDMNRSIYEQRPQITPLKLKNNLFVPVKGDTLTFESNLIGVGINLKDFMDGSDNDIAFNNATLFMDDSIQCRIRLDDIGYDVTRYVNAYADYKTHELNKKWIQCLFQIPGNRLSQIYEYENVQKGALVLDKNVHKIQVKVTDDKNNASTIEFFIRYMGKQNDSTTCQYLFGFAKANTFQNDHVQFTIEPGLLYDSICFKYSSNPDLKDFSDKHQIHYSYVPIHHYFDLNIKTNKPVPPKLQNKIVIRYSGGKDEDGKAALPVEQGWYKASVRNFGMYWLVADTVAPVIKSMQKNGANLASAKQISFVVKDSLTSVKKFRGEIDGKWVCFEQHNDLFFYKFDEHCGHGKHKLVFTATDENNNTTTYRLNFTR